MQQCCGVAEHPYELFGGIFEIGILQCVDAADHHVARLVDFYSLDPLLVDDGALAQYRCKLRIAYQAEKHVDVVDFHLDMKRIILALHNIRRGCIGLVPRALPTFCLPTDGIR